MKLKNFIKLKLYIAYYSFKFFFNFFFIKRVSINNIENIIIFGKGKSLNYFKNFFEKKNKINPNTTLIILNNFENNDLIRLKLKKLINDFPILFFVNGIEPILNFKNLVGLKIFRTYIMRFKPKNKKVFKNRLFQTRTNYRLRSISRKTHYLPDILYKKILTINHQHEKKLMSLNAGLCSILLAQYLRPKKIFIFGIDFYEKNSFNNRLVNTRKDMKMLRATSNKFCNCFNHIIKTSTNIKFEIYTYAKVKVNKKLKIFRLLKDFR
jgi:hypothetical protein